MIKNIDDSLLIPVLLTFVGQIYVKTDENIGLWLRAPRFKNVTPAKSLYTSKLSEFFKNKDWNAETKFLQRFIGLGWSKYGYWRLPGYHVQLQTQSIIITRNSKNRGSSKDMGFTWKPAEEMKKRTKNLVLPSQNKPNEYNGLQSCN